MLLSPAKLLLNILNWVPCTFNLEIGNIVTRVHKALFSFVVIIQIGKRKISPFVFNVTLLMRLSKVAFFVQKQPMFIGYKYPMQ